MCLETYVRKTDDKTIYRFKFFIKGHRYQGTLGPIPRKDALKLEHLERAKVEAGVYLPKPRQPPAPSVPTVELVANRFIAWYTTDHRPRSTARHITRLRWHLLPLLYDKPMTLLTTAWLDAYVAQRGREGAAPRTINGELSTLSALLHKAVEWNILSPAQIPHLTWLRTEPTVIRVLTAQEESALLLAAPPMLRHLIVVALHTGLRRGELVGLTWSDVDLVHRVVTVVSERAKNRRLRRVPLDDTAMNVLRALPQGELAFLRKLTSMELQSRIFGYHSLSETFARTVRRAKLPGVTCHSLRHTFASRCVEAEIPVSAVQKWLGHQSLSMTERYLHHTAAYEHDLICRISSGSRSSI